MSCVLFPEVIFRLVLKQIYFRPVPASSTEQRVSGADSPKAESFINLALRELAFN